MQYIIILECDIFENKLYFVLLMLDDIRNIGSVFNREYKLS